MNAFGWHCKAFGLYKKHSHGQQAAAASMGVQILIGVGIDPRQSNAGGKKGSNSVKRITVLFSAI